MKKYILFTLLTVMSKSILAGVLISESAQIRTHAPIYGRALLVETKTKEQLYIYTALNAKDNKVLDLTALDNKGKLVAAMQLIMPENPKDALVLLGAHLNSRNEIIVTTNYKDVIYSNNMTTKSGRVLISIGKFARVVSRLVVDSKNIVAVSADLDRGPDDTYPQLIRVIDEDTGKVLQQQVLKHPASGKLGLNSRGELKLLLFGYEILGLMDVVSGVYQDLFPVRSQPSSYPAEITIGGVDLLQFKDEAEVKLLSIQDLFEEKTSAFKTLSANANILNGNGLKYSVLFEKDGMQIFETLSGKNVGLKIPKFGPPTNQISGASISQLIDVGHDLVALISEPLVPHSFMPGTVLTYISVTTGKVLRTSRLEMHSLFGQIVLDKSSGLLAIESKRHAPNDSGFTVIDLKLNTVITKNKNSMIGPVFKSLSGQSVALVTSSKDDEAAPICVVSIVNLDDKACIANELIHSAVKFGYDPYEVEDGKLKLPLLGKRSGFNYPQLGYSVFEVK